MSREPLRIAGASGFWGDRNDALLDQVRGGPVDFVLLDYLAEITMSILRVKKLRDPNAGYAGDFVKALGTALGDVVARGQHGEMAWLARNVQKRVDPRTLF